MVYHRGMKKNTKILLTSIGVCYLAAAVGSIGMLDSLTLWYPLLRKPFFTPPNWVFGPVWTLLYALMGYALYQIRIRNKSEKQSSALLWFWLQLILNALWSIVFFGLHLPGMAFILIIFLWFSIYKTIREFYSQLHFAGQLLIPYLCWVTFAGILNAAIVVLN